MMALGDDLGADQHIDLALGHGADRGLRFRPGPCKVSDEAMA